MQKWRYSQGFKSCLLPQGSFLLAHSRLGPRSGYVSSVISPTLPGNTRFCLRFYFALRGDPALSDDWNGSGFPCVQESLGQTLSFSGRFQPDGAGAGGLSAAAGGQAGEDLDSGREVQGDLDLSRRDFPDVPACQGQRKTVKGASCVEE